MQKPQNRLRGRGELLKRAQTSVFILIGVIVLLIVAILLSQVETAESEEAERIVAEQVPEEFAVLKQYVEKCLSDVTRDGLDRLGSQGGRIDPKAEGLDTSKVDPTEADGVYLSQYSDIFIPYWFYLRSNNNCDGNCQFGSHKLLLESDDEDEQTVQTELEDFITLGVYDCVANFNSLKQVGMDVSQDGLMDPTVYFRQEDVRVYLDFPLTVTNDLDTVIVSQFETVIDVPFRKLYEQAAILAQMFASNRYFEAVTLNLISSYSGTDSDQLPPFFSSTTDPVETAFWVAPEVKKQVIDMNTIHMNSIQLSTARNFEQYGDGSGSDLYRFLTIPINFTGDLGEYYQNRYTDFTFNTIYKPEWNIFFELNDGQQVIRPSSLYLSLFSFMAVNQFRTQYSVSYPIVISLSDPDALQQDGYSFNFAMESNIRYNSPLEPGFERNTFLLDTIASFDQGDETAFCDSSQRNSKAVNGTIFDLADDDSIEQAVITYACGDEFCPITYSGDDGYFESEFPLCMGGFISVFKPGYQTEVIPLTTSIEEEKDLGEITLKSVKRLNVSLIKRLAVKDATTNNWIFQNFNRSLDVQETALVTLTQIGLPPFVQPHVASFAVKGTDDINTVNTVDLIPGVYRVEGTINTLENYHIPADRRCKSGECATIDAIDLDARISGGIYFDEIAGFLTITGDELYSASEVTFFATGYDLKNIPITLRKVEDLNVMGDEQQLFAANLDHLRPEFS